ncbi:Zn-ribbon domain-containing OB-fold protein [Microbacterium sp. LRZ72]|uniref:Zn-ribbon domain-containing OB-fold protein n=1 Tax=Microbacterium sp. LRZ72 TaxID=2942481 RepID=UPI0039AFBC07
MTPASDWTSGDPRLLAQQCANGHRWYLPRLRCPKCGADVSLFEPSGLGTIFTGTTIHRRVDGKDDPVGIALVDLDDGIRIMARYLPGTPIGTRVKTTIVGDEAGQLLPYCEVLSK